MSKVTPPVVVSKPFTPAYERGTVTVGVEMEILRGMRLTIAVKPPAVIKKISRPINIQVVPLMRLRRLPVLGRGALAIGAAP